MTAPWGPALDAEIAYRHDQVRTQFGVRRQAWFRTPVRSGPRRHRGREGSEARRSELSFPLGGDRRVTPGPVGSAGAA